MGRPLISAGDRALLIEAAALAERGRFRVEPNPAVGAVLVRGGRIVGRGWHRAYGGPHAEVEALRAAGPRARGAVAYVTLEPCSTHGKTPPCVEALARARVARVVYAERDPNPAHGGRAARALRAAGIRVDGPVGLDGTRALLAPFLRALGAGRPWVIAKWAMSLDGRTSPAEGEGGALSGPRAGRLVHDLRGRVEAVAVGVGTALADDPRLTCRRHGGPPDDRPQPIAVVFDSALRTPLDARVVRESSPARPLLLFTARPGTSKAKALSALPGVVVVPAGGRDGRVDLALALRRLRALQVHRLLVEGGGTLAGAFLRAGCVDQVAALVAPRLLGGRDAPAPLVGTGIDDLACAPRLDPMRARRVGDDVWIDGLVAPPP